MIYKNIYNIKYIYFDLKKMFYKLYTITQKYQYFDELFYNKTLIQRILLIKTCFCAPRLW